MREKPALKNVYRIGCITALVLLAMAAGEARTHGDVEGRPERDAGDMYPRLTYRMLLNDGDFLKGEKFTGVVHPREILKPVAKLRRISGKDMRVVKALTTSGKNALYVIVPAASLPRISKLIKKNKSLDLVYTPAGLYAGLPLIKLVGEERGGDEAGESLPDFGAGIASYYPGEKGRRWTIVIGDRLRLLEFEITDVRPGISRGLRHESVPGRPDLDVSNPFMIEYAKNSVSVSIGAPGDDGQAAMKGDLLIKGPVAVGTRWTSTSGGVLRQREIVATNIIVSTGSSEYNNAIVIKEVSDVTAGDNLRYIAVTYYFYAAGFGFVGCKIDSAETPEGIRSYEDIDEWFMRRAD